MSEQILVARVPSNKTFYPLSGSSEADIYTLFLKYFLSLYHLYHRKPRFVKSIRYVAIELQETGSFLAASRKDS